MRLAPVFHPPFPLHTPSNIPKRSRTPILSQVTPTEIKVNLSGSHVRVSENAITAITKVYTETNGAIHHGSCAHQLGRQAADLLSSSRSKIATAIGASSPNEIIFAASANAAMTIFAQSFAQTLRPGDEIVLGGLESDHTFLTWHTLAHHYGLVIKDASPEMPEGVVSFEAVASLLSSKTRLAVLQQTCALGTSTPIEEIAEFFASVEVPLLVDVSNIMRWAHLVPQKLEGVFLIASGDGLGVPGCALLYGDMLRLKKMPPAMGGDNTLEEYFCEHKEAWSRTDWGPVPERFEVGMPLLAGAAGLAMAFEELATNNGAFARRSANLGRYLYDCLSDCPYVILFGNEEIQVPVGCFYVEGLESSDIAAELARKGVYVNVGWHGCKVALQEFGAPFCIRVVLHPDEHKEEDVDNFVDILTNVVEFLSA